MYEGLDNKLEFLKTHFSDLPGFVFIKDLSGHILYMNDEFIQEIGCNSLSCVTGKTDKQLPWAKYSKIYEAVDRQVIGSELCFSNQEPTENFHKKSSIVATKKKPFYHNNKVAGLWGVAVKVTPAFINKEAPFNPSMCFIDLQRQQSLNLTVRQKEILYWLLKGYSSKETAYRTNISFRTVEHHVTAIRECNQYESSKEMLMQVHFV